MSLAVLAYLIAVAVVPPGYMAAPLASGTAFHLCPGDARSSLLINALTNAAPAVDHHDHHQHGHGGLDGDSSGATTSAEPDCRFAGISTVSLGKAFVAADKPLPALLVQTVQREPAHREASWLRPPVRSPPA
ncbi:hypothetical protein Q6D67_19340 [Haliea sp. E1-2-M8]|uniref:hypothetical protein n=1 Tax=Haliea sp. E1-2-M8 TaxID=3064706 RepID=UPI002728B38A|nr:hypothetical protein [Haliea sp. E1-2-M8]MDO8863848.1 hypothetical protein [Haliea sp. E1-2-M8]